ncbi:hypothetical protein C7974DRAFT_28876 [Boeremia exigua]|uniref:uncharacterized protein n=1 Tax=Boeremia exigua TaxID=749465 RepID=UPI001E8D6824|nr:uncharacterized protein C7974DRAFT_28876 [Boeremia exigua]KAH6644852.1 hypothetical protein C7974DRAFT_28876 [Boeremia exigua]
MRLSPLAPGLALLAASAAAVKTSIYINEIAGYSALAPCAENRVSAIVRAQASGCGDAQQLTSFSCFCIDQSSHISSVLSTAVQEFCLAQATTTRTASVTAALPEVTAAIDVFDSYCARSTELSWYQGASTASSALNSLITPAPSTTGAASSSNAASASSSATSAAPASNLGGASVPVAAIAAPVVIGVIAIAGVIGLFFWLRRRRPAAAAVKDESRAPPTYSHGELEPSTRHEVPNAVPEMAGAGAVKYRYELDSQAAELAGGKPRV